MGAMSRFAWLLRWAYETNVPLMAASDRIRQHVHYVESTDGTRLAWAEAGAGPVLVKAANWLTHLEYELDSPVWRHWIQFLSTQHRFIRYDERGCGMSGWGGAEGLSVEQWVDDLSVVIDAASPDAPVTLLGISQGAIACIRYAIRHPERVTKLILYGGYARGALNRGTPVAQRAHQAMIDLARASWASDNPTFRQVFTSRFIPGGSLEQTQWFNELCLKATSGEVAAALLEARARVDITASLSQVRTPTLVLHARLDEVVAIDEGSLLASGIAGAEFIELDSRNHVLLEHEPAWERFKEALLAFVRPGTSADDRPFAELSVRERQVLALIADGLGNAAIAERLKISEKTVRNHSSNVFDKLGVWSRAQAIVFARERGFGG